MIVTTRENLKTKTHLSKKKEKSASAGEGEGGVYWPLLIINTLLQEKCKTKHVLYKVVY